MKPPDRWVFSWAALAAVAVGLLAGSLAGWVPIPPTEVLGFVTGAACVMLVVRESLWNYPVGIANNVFFIALFWQSRLYGDMGLQVVYVGLAASGWYQWLHGGKGHGRLTVRRVGLTEAGILGLVGVSLTAGLTVYFRAVNDSAPFLDAVTTALSLVAQWLLNGKRIENWWVWIAADVLYVYLYTSKGLYLTAVLYAGFIGLCVAGFLAWRQALAGSRSEVSVTTRAGAAP
jgi:nicotinamide mononucleotide transporter